MAPKYLPFVDAGSESLPMSRLLRLSLFQVSVGLCSVLLIGTLNRVMIVELNVPAGLVAVMLAIPVLFAPFRALIGFRSDKHQSALGWRRFPYVWKGAVIMFSGLSVMPFALIILSGDSQGPEWAGPVSAAVAFLVVGIGIHTVQTAGLALATDLTPPDKQPQVVAFLSVLLLIGMLAGSLIFGAILADFTQIKLIQSIQGCAVVCLLLTTAALWRQEIRGASHKIEPIAESFSEAWGTMRRQGPWVRRLVAAGLGTSAFAMQDILLEPYGAQMLGLSVSATTLLTAMLASGGIVGFIVAARRLVGGSDPHRVAGFGALIGAVAFVFIIFAAPMNSHALLSLGTVLIGFGAGLFTHATLTSCMQAAPAGQAGLALGIWGAVQATSAGVAIGVGGAMRDIVSAAAMGGHLGPGLLHPATGYAAVYSLEIILLFATLVAVGPLVRPAARVLAVPSLQP